MTPELLEVIERRYGLHLEPRQVLTGGYECQVWGVESNCGALVVRISPAWRTLEEIAWTHHLISFTSVAIPEAVVPLAAADGSTLFLYRDQPVAIFPFVSGQPLDRAQAHLAESAAKLLARLHRRMRAWPEHWERPQPGPMAPMNRPLADDPTELADLTLDAWHSRIQRHKPALTVGPIHGDYYRANLRCVRDRIVGVIDWDDSAIDWIISEVAWATWEFSKSITGDHLNMERARAFLEAYRVAGGPCQDEEYQHFIPFIRWRLREEVRQSLAAAERGEDWDREYMEQEVEAFRRLQGQVLCA